MNKLSWINSTWRYGINGIQKNEMEDEAGEWAMESDCAPLTVISST